MKGARDADFFAAACFANPGEDVSIPVLTKRSVGDELRSIIDVNVDLSLHIIGAEKLPLLLDPF